MVLTYGELQQHTSSSIRNDSLFQSPVPTHNLDIGPPKGFLALSIGLVPMLSHQERRKGALRGGTTGLAVRTRKGVGGFDESSTLSFWWHCDSSSRSSTQSR